MEQKLNQFKRKLAKNKQSDSDVFRIHSLLEYGFPFSPAAVAFDPELSLLAVASKQGEIRIYGKHGVQLRAQHQKPTETQQLLFIPNEGRLLSVGVEGDRGKVTLFETNLKGDILEEKKTLFVDAGDVKPKKVSKCAFSNDFNKLFIGTEVGDVLIMDVKTCQLDESAIHFDVAIQNIPDDLKVNPGSVAALELHPTEAQLVLIGYNSGLLVLWNLEDSFAQGTFFTSCEKLNSVSWYKDGSKFLTAHEDGSFFTWSKDVEKQYNGPKQEFPFGEDEPCKSIGKIQVQLTQAEDEIILFSGGLPKDTYATVNSFTVKKGDKEVHYEVASPVVDFIILPTNSESSDTTIDNPNALMVLTERELVAVDLQLDDIDYKRQLYPAFKKPYLNSASPNDVACLHVLEDVEPDFLEKLRAYGKYEFCEFSFRKWPVTGGKLDDINSDKLNVLVTGQTDGRIGFYDISHGKFELIYSLDLSDYFKSDDLDEESADTEPLGDVKLRKIGERFDVAVDDTRFAVCKLYICPKTYSLFAGSHSGQVVVFDFEASNQEEIKVHELTIVSEDTGFKWKGCHPAHPKEADSFHEFPAGYCISYVVQSEPPAPVTAMAINTQSNLIAVGTSHGFGIFDCTQTKAIFSRSTLAENEEAYNAKPSKAKSLKDGIRNSFRRLKPKKTEGQGAASPPSLGKTPEVKEEETAPEIEEGKKEEEAAKETEEAPKVDEGEEEKAEETTKTDESAEEKKKEETPVDEEKKEEDVTASGDTAEEVTEEMGDGEEKAEEVKAEEEKQEDETEAQGESEPPKTDEEKLEEQEQEVKPEPETEAEVAADTADKPGVTIAEPAVTVDTSAAAHTHAHDRTLQSTVRCVSFADTFLRSSKEPAASLWVGTHSGTVYSYLVDSVAGEAEAGTGVRLAKEIRLHHRAPIVHITVLDQSGAPAPDPAAVAATKAPAADMSGHHHLLVCSEEQIKLFTLPALKAKYKEKIAPTAEHKVKQACTIRHKQNEDDTTRNYLACFLAQGTVSVLSLPGLFAQFSDSLGCVDLKAALECTQDGSLYNLNETHLITHVALVRSLTTPTFTIELPEGARPESEPEPEPVAEPEKEEEPEAGEEETAEPVADEPGTSGGPEAEDLPTVEDEAKQMIEDAEEDKESEFQKRIQQELTPDNPELTTVTTTTYSAIESRTIISADDGSQVAKIITTTRDTTLSMDGEVLTQKTQQKEEFEMSPSEEHPPGPLIAETDRTATLNSEAGDGDVVTHHIGEDPEGEEGVTGDCYGGSSGKLYSPLAREGDEGETSAVAGVEEEAKWDLTGDCYGGSNGELYSPLSKENHADAGDEEAASPAFANGTHHEAEGEDETSKAAAAVKTVEGGLIADADTAVWVAAE